MSAIRKGTCGMPGPYGAHCTEPPMHRYSCYDAGDDVSFNERMMRDDDLVHECNDPLCHGRTVLMSSSNDTEYTPTDVDVRVRYALDRGSAIQRPYSTALADFDRWLAAHDAELTERVRAEALAEQEVEWGVRTAKHTIKPSIDEANARVLLASTEYWDAAIVRRTVTPWETVEIRAAGNNNLEGSR